MIANERGVSVRAGCMAPNLSGPPSRAIVNGGLNLAALFQHGLHCGVRPLARGNVGFQ
jgi:hypothetical protein